MDNSIGDQRTMKTDVPVAGDRSLGDARTMRPGGAGAAGRRFREGELLLGRYRVVGELGQGGMGVVYRCSDETAGIEVALKALPPEVGRSSGEMEEVRANFRLVEKLHHPNIANVKTLERDPESGDCYLVMELVDGYDVRQWVRRRKEEGRPLTLDEVTIIAYRIAEALDYAHGEGVVHRDIKPSNVRVDFDGNVKVLDFGLAAQISTSQSRVSRAAAQGTGGTAPYMAPEQWRGRRQGAAADQYALAAAVYELLEGAPPFEGSDPVILREAVLSDTPAPVAGAPEHVNAALLRALSKEPEARFASCGAFVKALAGKGSEGGGSGAASRQPEVGDRKPDVGSRRSGAECRASGAGSWKWLWAAVAAAAVTYGAYRAYEAHGARRAAESRAEASRREAEVLRVSAGRREAELTAAARKEKEEAERLRLSAVEGKVKAEAELARLRKETQGAQGDATPKTEVVRPHAPVWGEGWVSPSTGMEFVWVPALKVWVGKYEVTNGEYQKKVPGHDSKEFKGYILNGGRQPVVYVNFDDAKTYAAWLTERDAGCLGVFRYRVISEQEWLSCAQCGDRREYPWGNSMPPKWGNFSDSASAWSAKIRGYTDGFAVTCDVERSGVNEWGLYGVGGNVWECCASDASGLSFGTWRGASWHVNDPENLRCSYGISRHASYRDDLRGFRLVLSPGFTTRPGTAADAVPGAAPPRSVSAPQSNLPSGHAWTNSLGMVFVPVPGTKVLFSIWITRVKDFSAFVNDSAKNAGYDYRKGPVPATWIPGEGWGNRGFEYDWQKPGFPQSPEHPVTCVNWNDAKAFCKWLTAKERMAGVLSARQCYRLPTDDEWSWAVGIGEMEGKGTPMEKNRKLKGVYPWGTQWPPPSGVGNLSRQLHVDDYDLGTSPVGSFVANRYGLYDMSGNVWQWCEDYFDPNRANRKKSERVQRGGCWGGTWEQAGSADGVLLSSHRCHFEPNLRNNFQGFRVVLTQGNALTTE